jgi:hypothetical protein
VVHELCDQHGVAVDDFDRAHRAAAEAFRAGMSGCVQVYERDTASGADTDSAAEDSEPRLAQEYRDIHGYDAESAAAHAAVERLDADLYEPDVTARDTDAVLGRIDAVLAEEQAQPDAERESVEAAAASDRSARVNASLAASGCADWWDDVQESADDVPLAEQVAECGHAVNAAKAAVRHAEITNEDTHRAQRCARWNADDQAAAAAADDNDGQELG